MPIKTKRWNDPAELDDGVRILVCRYRPRGGVASTEAGGARRSLRGRFGTLPGFRGEKSDETWDVWKELGPSVALHAAYRGKSGKPLSWSQYRRRYLEEMQAETYRLAGLRAQVKKGETITLLCSSACTDAEHCHRTLLKDLILGRASMKHDVEGRLHSRSQSH
jgi:uncharacterized protein YeaO (DUF488 family)